MRCNRMRGFLIVLALVMALMGLEVGFASDARAATVPITKIAFKYKATSISLNNTVQLTTTISPKSHNDSIQWSSSDDSIVSVLNGAVTGRSVGTAVITATTPGGVTNSISITVKSVAVKSVSLNKTAVTVSPGRTYQLKASASPSNASDKTIAFASSNPLVATVDQNGLVTAGVRGTATISARSSNGKQKTCKVTVKPVMVKSVKLSKTSVTSSLGATFTLSATITPADAYDTTLVWKSSNTAVAQVDAKGQVTVTGYGSAKITASAQDGSKKSASCNVTAKVIRVSSFTLSDLTKSMNVGETVKMGAAVAPANASYPTITWSIADPSIATVDADGNITGKKAGSTRLTASVDQNRKTAEATIRVRSGKPTMITISAVGDVILGGDPRKGSLAKFENYFNERGKDYGSIFKNVQSIFAADDLTIANLEAPLTSYNSYSEVKDYVYKGRPEYTQFLKAGNIEVVNIANNHILDCRMTGYNHTKINLDNAGIHYSGMYSERPIINVKGVKVGFMAFSNSAVSTSGVKKAVQGMRSSCDILVVSFHWVASPEHRTTADSLQKKLARAAVDAGADLVLGHHQHCIQGIEKYKGRHIVYGLGNFVVVGTEPDTDTFIFQQTFAVDGGYAEDGGINVIPCSTTSDPTVNNIQPMLLSGEAAQNVINRLKRYSAGMYGPVDY